jgi:hypothetical protein
VGQPERRGGPCPVTDVWDWVDECRARALATGDRRRLRLTQIHAAAYEHRHTEPARMLALLDAGRRLADALDEPWWVLFFDHWRLETLLCYLCDYRPLLELGARLTLELRRPVFAAHPLRHAVWLNLVSSYLAVDPLGHVGPVREALGFLEAELPAHGEERYMLLACRQRLARELGRLDEAIAWDLKALERADADPDRGQARHHAVGAHTTLCSSSFHKGDWAALAEYACRGEELARAHGAQYETALFLVWRALAERQAGHAETARRLFQRGTTQMARLGTPPEDDYYDALCAYHELAGRPLAALEVRDRELAALLGLGQLSSEAECRIKRCRLLARLGRPLEDELREAHAAIARLRDPRPYLAQLDGLPGAR